MIQNFQKQKIKLRKDPIKFQKIKNTYNKASNQFFLNNRPPKSGNSDSKYNLEIFKTKIKLKKGPLKFQKIKNIY